MLILGMHRSGTSFLAGSLQEAGLVMEGASTFDKHNRKGNRERRDVVAFHDEMLAARGAAWNAPPAGPVDWTEAEYARARALAPADPEVTWGFKDPRTLLVIEGWRALYPGAPMIGILRHPVMVVRSLSARGTRKVKGRAAFDLWEAYNRRLLALHEATPFPLLSFDTDPQVLQTQLAHLLPGLGLTPASDSFFAAELRHHEREAEKPPEHLRALYAALLARRVGT